MIKTAFRLKANPFPGDGEIPLGLYELPRRTVRRTSTVWATRWPYKSFVGPRTPTAALGDHVRFLWHRSQSLRATAVRRAVGRPYREHVLSPIA